MNCTSPLLWSLVLICMFFNACQMDSGASLVQTEKQNSQESSSRPAAGPTIPGDWFFAQRAVGKAPDGGQIRQLIAAAQVARFKARMRDEAVWEQLGPYNVGGRITDIEWPAADTIFLASASGGIFKSVNAGATFDPILDELGALPVGDIEIASSDPKIMYAGTGEANGGGGSIAYDGIGILKSEDAGESWAQIGLESMGSTGKLDIDPTDPNRVFAAMTGRLFADDNNRGLYRTEDGGASWDQVLYINDSTGAVDVSIDPFNSNVIYAAMWERVRKPNRRDYGGAACGIYKSVDGGDNWTKLSGGGIPGGVNNGRIAVAASPIQPNLVYAIYMKRNGAFKGFYRSDDAGATWTFSSTTLLSSNYATYGWWFTGLDLHPTDPDKLTTAGLAYLQSNDGGTNWSYLGTFSTHVDQHALAFHPENPTEMLLGTDGGLYHTNNGGSTWIHFENIANNQFYKVAAHPSDPALFFGGTQDNGTLKSDGPLNWSTVNGGDGFVVQIDPVDNNYVYAESQYGIISRSTNGGNSFFSALSGIDLSDRLNWQTPFIIDPNEHTRLYYGSNRLYRSDNQASSWSPVSTDLTQGDIGGNINYGTITAIAVSKSDSNIILTGADDGSVYASTDMAGSFMDVGDGLPDRWVTSIEADPLRDSTFYICISGYRYGDEPMPHIFQTNNAGASWFSIAGDLPEVPVNDVLVDTASGAFFAATDLGVYFSVDSGAAWNRLGDLPVVVVTDLDLQYPSGTLIAGTYGRSMYSFDLENLTTTPPISGLTTWQSSATLFPNPVSDILYIQFEGQNIPGKVLVYNTKGQQVLAADPASGIRVHNLPSARYFLLDEQRSVVLGSFVKH